MKALILPAVLFTMLSSTSALAESDSVQYKEVDGWTVYMDPTLGNACYVATVYDDGTLLRMGFDFSTAERRVYFALGNGNWKSLEAGKEYPVEIKFDNNPSWTANALAREMGNIKMLSIFTTDTTFVAEFTRKLSVRATFSGREIAHLRLSGSSKAVNAMLECQESVNRMIGQRPPPPKNQDPFQQTPDVRNATDPFEL